MNIPLSESFRALLIAENHRQKPPVECRLNPQTLDDLRVEMADKPKFVLPLTLFSKVLQDLNEPRHVNFCSMDGVLLLADESVPIGDFRFVSV